ncbi:biotin--[acetyl-CoA-carboxylase] ligase [bacterium]|nr:biotin--[acetyl-CoA-carboxylase] ligase [bacterium]
MLKINKIIDFESIDSTSKYLKENYNNLDDLTFVSSLYQTSGRGRMDRSWESNKGENLLFSLLIKDRELINKFSSISLLSSVVILNVLKHKYKIQDVSIKWPNDVYIDNKKVAGILLEGISISNNIQCIVLGIGINVNQMSFVNSNAYSISLALNKKIDLLSFKNRIYDELINELSLLKDNKSSYLDVIREHNFLKGKEVYALINNNRTLSKVIDINDDNTLKVVSDGIEYNLFSDEVTFHL